MNQIDYFKSKSKKFLRDFKTIVPEVLEEGSCFCVFGEFDIYGLVRHFELEKRQSDFKLMNAQHIVAQLAGFKQWNDLIKATEKELEIARLVFDYCSYDSRIIEKWNERKSSFNFESMNVDEKLDFVKEYFEDSIYDDFPTFDWDMDNLYMSEYY